MQNRNNEWLKEQYNLNTPHRLSLDIDKNDIPMVCQFLTDNPVITELDLGYIKEKSNHINDEGACILAEWLVNNKTLLNLIIDNNGIKNEGATALAKALEINHTLLHIKLSGMNEIESDGAKAFAKMLNVNTTLLSLDLLRQDIQSDGLSCIGNALRKNRSLKSIKLHVYEPDCDVAGLKDLAAGLEENTGIKSFSLQGNCVDNEGTTALCNMLVKNKIIRKLDLSLIQISSIDKKLEEALKANKTLLSINVRDILEENPEYIKVILNRNKELCKLNETSIINNTIMVFQGARSNTLFAKLPVELLFRILIFTTDNIRRPEDILEMFNLVNINMRNRKWEITQNGKQIFQIWKPVLTDEQVIKRLSNNKSNIESKVTENKDKGCPMHN